MVASFKDIAAAMTRCVAIIEDYARLAPSALTTTAALAAVQDGTAADALITGSGKKQRNKKDKKPKDPNAPKRPPSAYLLFQNDIREQIRTAHPGLPYKEVLSVIAHRWKDLDDNARKVYEDAYNAATIAFRQQDEAYKLTGTIPPSLLPNAEASSDSDDSVSSDEEDTGVTPTKVPLTLAATPLTSSGKKDKKRKNKEEEVVATPVVESGKKEVSKLRTAGTDGQKKKAKKNKE